MSDRHVSEDISWFGSTGRFKLVVASEALTCVGATEVTTSLIPAGVFVFGVCVRVTTLITGATTFTIGDGTDVDRWGTGIGLTVGTTTDATDWTAIDTEGKYETSGAAADVTLTATGSDFTAGVVLVTAYYLQLVP